MDFDSGWGDDEDGGDSWGDDEDGDDGWKRKKREAVKVEKEKMKMKRSVEEVERALFPKEENQRVRREVEISEEENKRVRREAAAKWRKGTQVLYMYFESNICINLVKHFCLCCEICLSLSLNICCFSLVRMWWRRWRNSGVEQTTLPCGFLRWSGL